MDFNISNRKIQLIVKPFFLLAMFLLLQACSTEPNIVITKNFISNKYWDDYNNAIYIEKMKIKKDSVLDIFNPNFETGGVNNWNVVNKLEVDSSFMYSYSGLGKVSELDIDMMKDNLKKNKAKLKEEEIIYDSLINFEMRNTISKVKLNDKVFFNKSNGFYWNFGYVYYGYKKTDKETIGSLENNSWYKFSNLRDRAYYVYVYVDSLGGTHCFSQDLSNF